jgi:hypothetical protein
MVAITICSWIAISNHCAFAAMSTTTDSQQTACPFHSKPEKPTQQSAQVQCCKTLRAVFCAKAKSWARDTSFFDVDLYAEERALIVCSLRTPEPLLLDTGPPDAHSFAELVLQQSLFAHAPPSLT